MHESGVDARLPDRVYSAILSRSRPLESGGSKVLGRVVAMIAAYVLHERSARSKTPPAGRGLPWGAGPGIPRQVSPMFRISHHDREAIVDVDQVEAIEPAIRSSEPGRYHVDEIAADPLPSGHTSRRWGVRIKRHDGTVVIEPDPWSESPATE
jgi:hypothetical protein